MPPKKNVLGEKHFPVSGGEVDQWLERVNDITTSMDDFLHEDPAVEAQRKAEREQMLRAEALRRDQERRRRRYDTKYYARFEGEDIIEKMLEEVDKPPAAEELPAPNLSGFEKLTLEQANKKKAEGNAKVAAQEWAEAKALYDNAIGMEPPDDKLLLALRNNRAMVEVKLELWEPAVTDASYVLQRDRHNVKALLRRARGLVGMHRPTDAMSDIEHVLRGDSRNTEALALMKDARREQEEIAWADQVREDDPAAVETLVNATHGLKAVVDELITAVVPQVPAAESAEPDTDTADADAAEADDAAEKSVEPPNVTEEQLQKVTVQMCEVGSHLGRIGCPTVFRLANGVQQLERLFTALEMLPLDKAPANIVFWASFLRVFARAVDTPIASAMFFESALFPTMASFAVVAGGAEHPLLSSAALQLVGAAATDHRAAVALWDHVQSEGLLKSIKNTKDPRVLDALKLGDKLLRADELRPAVVGAAKWTTLCTEALRAHPALRDAGAAMLARLSAAPSWLDSFATNPQLALQVTTVLKTMLQDAADNAFAAEALLAVVHNWSIKPDRRQAAAGLLVSTGVAADLVRLCANEGRVLTRTTIANVVARSVGVLAKLVLASSEIERVVCDHLPALMRWCTIETAMLGNVGTDAQYLDVVVENCALIAASLVARGSNPRAAAAAFADEAMFGSMVRLLTLSPRIVGNAAMVLAALPALLGEPVLQWATPCQLATSSLDAIKRLRAEVHQMESDGHRDSTNWTQAKSAKKNVAIALSKYCVNDVVMQTMRDNRGVEILYSALDETDKATK